MSVFVLKRIGAPSTTGVPDILRLENGLTQFGRERTNHHVIDSTRYKCMISRKHAQILISEDSIEIFDNSLNGSYVNDYKIDKRCRLTPGDIIAFGHLNAQQIKIGEYAPQTSSEFRFKLEKVTETDIENYNMQFMARYSYDSYYEHNNNTAENNTNRETNAETPDNNDNNSSLHTNTNNAQQGSPPVPLSNTLPKPDFTEEINGSRKVLHRQTSQFESTVINESSHQSNGSDHSKISVIEKTTTVSEVEYESFNDTVNGVRMIVSAFCTSDASEEDIFHETSVSDNSYQKSHPISAELDLVSDNYNTSKPVRKDLHSSVGKKHKREPSTSTVKSSTEANTGRDKGRSRGRGRGGKTGIDTHKRKSSTEKKSAGKTSRKKQRKSEEDIEREDEEDGDDEQDEWSDYGDECASTECCKPDHDKVEWVQCDDCDQWYHMECVDCNSEVLKRDNIEFHCGCQ